MSLILLMTFMVLKNRRHDVDDFDFVLCLRFKSIRKTESAFLWSIFL